MWYLAVLSCRCMVAAVLLKPIVSVAATSVAVPSCTRDAWVRQRPYRPRERRIQQYPSRRIGSKVRKCECRTCCVPSIISFHRLNCEKPAPVVDLEPNFACSCSQEGGGKAFKATEMTPFLQDRMLAHEISALRLHH